MDRRIRWRAHAGGAAFYGLMLTGLWLMLSASSSYWELGDTHPFFLEKLPLSHPRWWLAALYVHVPSALFSLPACLWLTLQSARARGPRLHRWLGRVTGAVVLAAVVPSGMYLALFAQGGMASTLGFWLTGSITFVAMAKSIVSARRRDLGAHRRFSAHVTSQLGVAVFSRLLLAGAELIGAYDEWVYIAALWLPVVGSVVASELLTRPRRPSLTSKGADHEIAAAVRLDAVR